MLNINDNPEKYTIHLLEKTKQNYNLTSKQIAHELDMTETAVSRWFNEKVTPNRSTLHKIWDKIFSQYWEIGVLRLPPNSQWLCDYFIAVRDIKNPFETFMIDEEFENGPYRFIQMVEECENLNSIIYRTYEKFPREIQPTLLTKDIQKLNTTMVFHRSLTAYPILEDVFIHSPGLNPAAFDYQLIKEKKAEIYGTRA